jgi:4-diphosphocytidyl-2-C-methyl-D-erythritol kinase
LALIDLADWIDVERRADGRLQRTGDVVGDIESDLPLRAARLLQQRTESRFGADIHVSKCIPAGAGLGGGSSDAATTLVALNRIWGTGLDRPQLAELALELGADVPFFVHGVNAFAEGRGERLTPVTLPPAHYAVIWPQVHVSTQQIFEDPGLTRNTKATKMLDFSAAADPVPQTLRECGETGTPVLFGANDLEAVARRRFPVIDQVLAHLARFGAARMTGSGSAVFAMTVTEEAARTAVAGVPDHWRAWVVRGLAEHPLRSW